QEWKSFRNALDKSERKIFDEMWDIPRLYLSACSNSVSLVPFHPIAISILFHHYKELKECIKQTERIITGGTTTVKVKDLETNEINIPEEVKDRQQTRKKQQLTLFDL
ncbi:MAG: hypothetical protein ACJ71K_03980, partial [Nitrososphaeraceae archaeon]